MKRIVLILSLFVSPVCAQQLPDPALLQKLIPSLEQQRNDAQNRAALAEARAALLTEELQKIKADAQKAKEAKPQE